MARSLRSAHIAQLSLTAMTRPHQCFVFVPAVHKNPHQQTPRASPSWCLGAGCLFFHWPVPHAGHTPPLLDSGRRLVERRPCLPNNLPASLFGPRWVPVPRTLSTLDIHRPSGTLVQRRLFPHCIHRAPLVGLRLVGHASTVVLTTCQHSGHIPAALNAPLGLWSSTCLFSCGPDTAILPLFGVMVSSGLH